MPKQHQEEQFTLSGLGETLTAWDGKPLFRDTDGEPLTKDKQLSPKHVLVECLGRMHPKSGKDTIIAYQVATQIYKATDKITISKEEYDIIKQAVTSNTPGFVPQVLGQVLSILEIELDNITKDGGPE